MTSRIPALRRSGRGRRVEPPPTFGLRPGRAEGIEGLPRGHLEAVRGLVAVAFLQLTAQREEAVLLAATSSTHGGRRQRGRRRGPACGFL